jgi:chlorobactene glucosyltransferase
VSYSSLGNEVDLPSVSICIPARNEGHALAYSLEKVLAIAYDKLEIIVLDDVSGDDTSALLRSFASEGVRFVKGTPLPDGWLGKNHALQGLLSEASGSYILFMDVDTRLSEQAVERLVRYALSKRVAMLSVLPFRADGWRASVLFSPLRYFWEVVTHRATSPATASSAWLIHRQTLKDQFDGFMALKDVVEPEAHIARILASSGRHAFLVGNEQFGVCYEKKWRSQLFTSVRLLYARCGYSILKATVLFMGLWVLITPFILLIVSTYMRDVALLWSALVVCLALCGVYAYYAAHVWKFGWPIAFIVFPYILIQEILLLIVSVVQYTVGNVRWKGRTIEPVARN